jgi:flavin-dependent dehydrogenase
VLGGGPAGAFAAERLAGQGTRAIVLDEKLAWEKPCGGGLTYKSYHRYPFLIENDTPKKVVRETVLGAPGVGNVRLKLESPLLIYSRLDLNRLLLERAVRAGAELDNTRVLGLDRRGDGWRIRTRASCIDADFCIVATGARNPLRDVGTQLSSSDSMSALGYFVPGDREQIDIEFLAGLDGYIWVFPRCGHLSVGICGKGEPASSLRKRLEVYMDEQGLSRVGAKFYSHLLPSLDTPAWKNNRVAGPGWLAVGDAAGLVDPITGEGLYYAMRSADLAAQALETNRSDVASAYQRLLGRDFAEDLEVGSRLAKRVFHGKFLVRSFPSRMVQITRRSPRIASIMQDLFAGTQDYTALKRRLLDSVSRGLLDVALSFGRRTVNE